VGWVGLTLVLSEVRRLRRPNLARRLAPHGDALDRPDRTPHASPLQAARVILGPIILGSGDRLLRALGVDDSLAARLQRLGTQVDAADFRLRQATKAAVAMIAALAASTVVPVPFVARLSMTLTAPVVTLLVIEQRTLSRSTAWQQSVGRELPVIAEQLGMLLSSGYSLGGAISRIGERGTGVSADACRRVVLRVRQGLTEIEALHEWAAVARVPSLDRLVRVLELNSHASDLGELISSEARNTRREAQRDLEALIERRSQSVWIPVTVATLLPGVIFMAIPFIDAMGKLTGR
jgi:Flp pilus assembly protein TadB